MIDRRGPEKNARLFGGFLVAGVLVAVCGGALSSVKPAPLPSRTIALAKLEPIALPDLVPGEEIVLKGSVRTSFDGTVYDALTRTDTTSAGAAVRRGGLFDPETTGFRVASLDPKTHEVHLVVTGTSGGGCAALSVAAPCLVPLVKEAAHERLLSEQEFRATLAGGLVAELPDAPPPPVPSTRTAGLATGIVGIFMSLFAIFGLVRTKRATPMAHVRRAADKALLETRGNRAFDTLRVKIDELVRHAEKLEAVRKTTAARLAKVDVRALEEKTRRLANQGAPADAKAWAEKELEGALELEKDHDKAVVGLARVESALGVVALSSREEKGVRVDDAVKNALGEIEDELAIRDAAVAEADAVTAKPRARQL